MGLGEKLRRLAGWCCLGLVAIFVLLGYFFGNIRFAPLAAGFLILSAVFLIELAPEHAQTNGIHPGTNSRVNRTSR
jgi:fatty acid desaturase